MREELKKRREMKERELQLREKEQSGEKEGGRSIWGKKDAAKVSDGKHKEIRAENASCV